MEQSPARLVAHRVLGPFQELEFLPGPGPGPGLVPGLDPGLVPDRVVACERAAGACCGLGYLAQVVHAALTAALAVLLELTTHTAGKRVLLAVGPADLVGPVGPADLAGPVGPDVLADHVGQFANGSFGQAVGSRELLAELGY